MPNFPISETAALNQYTAYAGQVLIPWTFWVESVDDLQLYIQGSLKAYDVDYTVDLTKVKTDAGGNITLSSALTGGESITVSRATKIKRATGFSEGGGGDFRPEALNLELSRLIVMLQDKARDLSRCFQLSKFSTFAGSVIMPEVNPGKGLRWNDAGTAIVNTSFNPDDVIPDAAEQAENAVVAAQEARAAADLAIAAAESVTSISGLTDKGDLLSFDGSFNARLPVGADHYNLRPLSTEATGLVWHPRVRVSGSPTMSGELGYSGGRVKVNVGIGNKDLAFTDDAGIPAVVAVSANATLVLADKGKFFVCSGTFTLSLTAAATLGSAWLCHVRNDGTGVLIIDPNGAELIDGLSAIRVYPGESFTVVCDGTGFKTLGRQKGLILINSVAPTGVTAVTFTDLDDPEMPNYKIKARGMVPVDDQVYFYLRTSANNGVSFANSASSYDWWLTPTRTSTVIGVDGDNVVRVNANQVGNAAGENGNFEIDLLDVQSTTKFKNCKIQSFISDYLGGLHASSYGGFQRRSTAIINAVNVFFQSGNINSGTIELWGERV